MYFCHCLIRHAHALCNIVRIEIPTVVRCDCNFDCGCNGHVVLFVLIIAVERFFFGYCTRIAANLNTLKVERCIVAPFVNHSPDHALAVFFIRPHEAFCVIVDAIH